MIAVRKIFIGVAIRETMSLRNTHNTQTPEFIWRETVRETRITRYSQWIQTAVVSTDTNKNESEFNISSMTNIRFLKALAQPDRSAVHSAINSDLPTHYTTLYTTLYTTPTATLLIDAWCMK